MSKLYDKILEEITFYSVMENSFDDWRILEQNEFGDAAKGIERLVIQAQVELLNELKNDTENTNAKFRLKLATMINELESQLK